MPPLNYYAGNGNPEMKVAIEGGDKTILPGFSVYNKDKRLKVQIDYAIKCLEFYANNEINTGERVVKLPDMAAGYFEYRIMVDCETDDRELWMELTGDNGEKVTALPDDLLILNR